MNAPVVCSRHATKRLRQRCGWKSKACARMVERAFLAGRRAEACTLGVGAFLGDRPHHPERQEACLYGQTVFIFEQRPDGAWLCLTAYGLPPNLRRALRSEGSRLGSPAARPSPGAPRQKPPAGKAGWAGRWDDLGRELEEDVAFA